MHSPQPSTKQLTYEISEEIESKLATGHRAVSALHSALRVWLITEPLVKPGIAPVPGAFVRTQISADQTPRFLHVQTNVTPAALHSPNASYYFLPDQLLIWREGAFSRFDYSELRIESRAVRFLERAGQPDDADQIEEVHRGLDGAGKLPILRYGSAEVYAGSTQLMHLLTSRTDSVSQFAQQMGALTHAEIEPARAADMANPLYTHFEGDRVPRYYQLSNDGIRQMQMFREAFVSIGLSECVWCYDSQQNTEDWRRNAGLVCLLRVRGSHPR